MEKILVIASHPDDEILGCGGTMRKLVNEGNKAYALILATGVTGRHEGTEKNMNNHIQEQVIRLRREGKEASKIIGYNETYFLNLPDNRLDSLPLLDIIK